MAFIKTKRRHTQSIMGSWLQAKWHELFQYKLKHEKRKMFESAGAGVLVSGGKAGACYLLSLGICSGIGAAVGSVAPVIGTIIGAGVGAAVGTVVGGVAAVVSIGTDLDISRRHYKRSRDKIYDRLTTSNYDYRKEFAKEFKTEPNDRTGFWFTVTTEGMTLDMVARQYEHHEISFDILWNHKRNKAVRKFIRKNAAPPTPRSEIVLEKKLDIWIPIAPGKNLFNSEIKNQIQHLTYLAKHSLRDSVVHLRHALDRHEKMMAQGEGLAEDAFYVPQEKMTLDQIVAVFNKRHPKLNFTKNDILGCEKNKPQPHWYETERGDTLESVCAKFDCKWFDVVEHESNKDLRKLLIMAGEDPVNPESRSKMGVHALGRVFIPGRIPENADSLRYRLRELNGKLTEYTQRKLNYIEPGKPVYYQLKKFGEGSFRDCDDMVSKCEPAFEFFHHLNKARNYILPTLNLTRMYLDIFDELKCYLLLAQQEFEEAVLDYMENGDHLDCNMREAFSDVAEAASRARHGTKWYSPVTHALLGDHVFGKKHMTYGCIRSALKRTKKGNVKPEEYTVTGDNETIESIAAEKKVPVYVLAAQNVDKLPETTEIVSFDPEKKEWEITKPPLDKGTVLEIPPAHKIDRFVYRNLWKKLGIKTPDPRKGVKGLSSDHEGNIFAFEQTSIAPTEVDQLTEKIDDIIDDYYKALATNRKRHKTGWKGAVGAKRRYRYFCGDVLHMHDSPSLAKRMGHKLTNINMKTTRSEKATFYLKSGSSIFFGSLFGGVSGLASPIWKGLDWKWGVGDLLFGPLDPTIRTLTGCPQPGFGGYIKELHDHGWKLAIKQGVSTGTSLTKLGAKSVGMKYVVIPEFIVKPKFKDDAKKRITSHQLLGFQRERMSATSVLIDPARTKDHERALKEAVQQTDDVFLKISRHFTNAWSQFFDNILWRLDEFEKHKDKPGKGLMGCKDCYEHLRKLYEFQHELDKVERYLLSTISLSFRLREWEQHLTGVEKELWNNLEKSAGEYIKNGDHSKCLRKKAIGHRHCYGARGPNASEPARPMKERAMGQFYPSRKLPTPPRPKTKHPAQPKPLDDSELD